MPPAGMGLRLNPPSVQVFGVEIPSLLAMHEVHHCVVLELQLNSNEVHHCGVPEVQLNWKFWPKNWTGDSSWGPRRWENALAAQLASVCHQPLTHHVVGVIGLSDV